MQNNGPVHNRDQHIYDRLDLWTSIGLSTILFMRSMDPYIYDRLGLWTSIGLWMVYLWQARSTDQYIYDRLGHGSRMKQIAEPSSL